MTISVRALLMIRPAQFGFNPQTAPTNSFQHHQEQDVHEQALVEFNSALLALAESGIPIEVFDDEISNPLPDSIFPNNWFSTHSPQTMLLYPMLTLNRRAERKASIVAAISKKFGYTTIHDLTAYESQNQFLEGTGSMVFDHEQQIAFACTSPRTNNEVLLEACERIGYLPVVFEALDRNKHSIYHTNVMMAITGKLAICCFDSIADLADRNGIRNYLKKTGKTIVEITIEQMESFAGNMLFILNKDNQLFVAVSATAWNSLNVSQKTTISALANEIIVDIPTIEKYGGGGIRCMLAELF